jgi:hypothetical protein
MARTCAPIALFVYNRPEHTRQTVEALRQNEFAGETPLVVFSDAWKNPVAKRHVLAVRDYIRSVEGFKSVAIVERPANAGLATSIIDGVTKVCSEYGRVIVVEDDMVTSPYFLRFMNEALDLYANDKAVASIQGYWYPVHSPMPETFFLRGADCWGWATWARAWQLFEPDGGKLLAELRRQNLGHRFDADGSRPYMRMLEDQIAGQNNSWAIRWQAATFLANCLQLSPGRSLVRNIGFDGTGIHSGESKMYDVELTTTPIEVLRIPQVESDAARAALARFYRKWHRSLLYRIVRRLLRIAGMRP